jgi:hypothetical protein
MSEIMETTCMNPCETRSEDGKIEFSELEYRRRLVDDWYRKNPWAAENDLLHRRIELEMEETR